MSSMVLLTILLMVSAVSMITNVNTLQQIINSETDTEMIHRVLQQPREIEPSGTGVETLQQIMKTSPLTRELQLLVGDSKTASLLTKADSDILARVKTAPTLVIPSNAPESTDLTKLIRKDPEEREDIISLEEDYLYEDIDKTSQRRADSLRSAFISNHDPFSLTLSPLSSLESSPGKLLFLTFFLKNLGEVTKFFLTSGVGSVAHDNVDNETTSLTRGRMVFPGQTSFIQTVTPDNILLDRNQSAQIKIGITVPPNVEAGSRQLLYVRATPAVVTDTVKPLTKQFYIRVIDDNDDDHAEAEAGPECHLVSDTYVQSCQGHQSSCSAHLWHASYQFSSPGTGVRDVMVSPTTHTGHYIVDNFIIGTQLTHDLYWTGDCCTHHLALHVTDTMGLQGVCHAGLQTVTQGGHSTVMVSSIIVVTIMLIVVIIVCVAIILAIRRKRMAQLEYLRQLPS